MRTARSAGRSTGSGSLKKIGAIGKRGEAAQVEEHRGDLAPVRSQDLLAAGDDRLDHLA